MSDVSDEELERAMANAKAMPKDTKKHREERSAAIETARNRKYSKKAIAKAGGKIVPFDNAVFEQLFAKEDANLAALTELETEISKAKRLRIRILNQDLKQKAKLKAERKEIEALIKRRRMKIRITTVLQSRILTQASSLFRLRITSIMRILRLCMTMQRHVMRKTDALRSKRLRSLRLSKRNEATA